MPGGRPRSMSTGRTTDEVRRLVQQHALGHRGHAGDPLYRIRNILRAGARHLGERRWDRLIDSLGRGDPDDDVMIARLPPEVR